ncbi:MULTISPECIES: TIGR02530 family flagellar biosynthesis protein [unclassified Paenibacillus]|uniref:TIGR02530 family flagellar biosynthesis protein n=1 Tax=unclassified Paenibacillus TaxID=185978 RepID=UPI002405AB39|nr:MULTISPECIES: TIGR02530 family flagellar biosynthesis protein [unclassified Paenibacillus]MDF9841379.1 flagellar operon protein [Paenibacillus sp. PastF-2]MDF9847970.1 flagellar operon protein [Paenibacillus sp. PastM-2]MDF9854538.1 flagellar operon protein [Paenibacillus sp. PastF-1]MDH6479853.1 flagellar operon protein [Paenibacillus sp. PastH-2]MDH6507245.1 flagellar operon protein [Paenibacillus sp. PastM-3]
MSDRLTIGQLYPGTVHPQVLQRSQTVKNAAGTEASFESVLQKNMLKFSNHAAKRLEQRGIELGSRQLDQISNAVEKAAAKGSKESLILLKDMALIVSVPNRTVVTAMDGSSMKDNVFTQIDSAVIIS